MLKIRLVNDIKGFESMRDVWHSLLEASDSRHVFMTWEWLFTWWRFFGKDRQLFILRIEENDELIGIAPFMLYVRNQRGAYLPYRTRYLHFIGFSSGGRWNDWMDIIAIRKERVLQAILNYLKGQQHLWDTLELWDIPEESDTVTTLSDSRGQSGFSVERERISVCPYTSTTSDWVSYYQYHVPKDVRVDLERQIRRLHGKGEMRVVRAEGSDITRSLEGLFDFSQRRQAARHQSSSFSDEIYRNFYRALAQVFPSACLDCSLLNLDGRTLAEHFGFRYNRKFYYVTPAFDPAYASLSPGKVLLRYLIEECFSDATIDEFDFLRGGETYKFHWATGTRHGCKIVVSNPLMSGWMAKVLGRVSPYVRRSLIGIRGSSRGR